jgi:PKD repeat protein
MNLTPTIDGYCMQDASYGTFTVMRNAAGDYCSSSGSVVGNNMKAYTSDGNWDQIRRSIFSFNTSMIGASNTTLSAKLYLSQSGKDNQYAEASTLAITGGTTASNASLANGDYARFTNTEYTSRTNYAAYAVDNSYLVLNINTLSYINKTGDTVFFARLGWDVDNSSPTWASAVTSYFSINTRNDIAARRPQLEITFGDPPSTPVSGFTVDYTGGISPLIVNFTDTSTNTPTVWNWYDNSTLFSSAQNPTFVPFYTGNHLIKLNASNAAGGSNTSGTWINVTDAITILPVAEFSANTTTGTVPLVVQFTDSSLDNILGWNWTFGDGYNSTQSNPLHIYTALGSYTVILEVVNASGYNTTTKTNYITGSAAPDTTAPRSITGLANGTVTNNSILWQWTNPTDTDFNHTVQYKNNVLYYNSSNTTAAIIWTGLTNNTAYTFSSHTVDLSGNMNSTWVNATATTNKLATPPAAPSGTSPFAGGVDTSAQMSMSLLGVFIIALIGLGIFTVVMVVNGGSLEPEVIVGIIIGVVIIIIFGYVISIISGTMSMIKI